MRRSLRRTFFRLERLTLTSRSLQSIMRPFQKRFREVFGNARILIFYLSIKAWEEKSLPKSHLGCFFLVFGEGKATKGNMSIFWFIWPLNDFSVRDKREKNDTCSVKIKNPPEHNPPARKKMVRTSGVVTWGRMRLPTLFFFYKAGVPFLPSPIPSSFPPPSSSPFHTYRTVI